MDVRTILETFDKETLIDLIIEYSDNGYFLLELFLLRAEYTFTPEILENAWNAFYVNAQKLEDEKLEKSADLLRDGAEMCFEQARRFFSEKDCRQFCQMLVDDLHTASEEDGIGMHFDSEWIYMEICNQIEDFLGEFYSDKG